MADRDNPDSDSATLLEAFRAANLRGLWVVFHDYAGRALAKWVVASEVASVAAGGVAYCLANLNFTQDDHLAHDARFTADAGDFVVLPDPATFAPLPYRAGMGRVLGFLCTEQGDPWEGCPRRRLVAACDALVAHGLAARAAWEPEWTLYRPTANGGYEPADRLSMYSLDRMDGYTALLDRTTQVLDAQGVTVERIGAEFGAGQMEINLRPAAPLRASDDLVTFRETVKALAKEAGLLASFMPKAYEDAPGNGVHLHFSLRSADGAEDRSAGDGPLGLSAELAHFTAGVLTHAPALCGVFAPTVNSYKRLQPASWAPAHIGYGGGNRAALVRVPGTSRPHIEFRAGDHTANPYLALAAFIAAGLDGIARRLDPGTPVAGDLGGMSADALATQGVRMLPRTLAVALDAVEADDVVMNALGGVCGPELLRIRRDELARYERHVGQWERDVYF